MKLRNTTDFDSAAIQGWLRRVVRHVETTLAKRHPLGWSEQETHERATLILSHCDIWIRQTRRDQEAHAKRVASAWRERAAGQRARGNERGAQAAEEHAERWIVDGGSGRAWFSGRRLRVTLHGADVISLLWLARHEIWHLFAVRHEHFPDAVMHETTSSRAAVATIFDVAEGTLLPLAKEPGPKRAPSAEERATEKLARLVAREKAWTIKLKRAETALSKIRRSRRYYEKQISGAAASAEKTPPQ